MYKFVLKTITGVVIHTSIPFKKVSDAQQAGKQYSELLPPGMLIDVKSC